MRISMVRKKVFKKFTDLKKFNEFTKKHPMPTFGSMLGFVVPKKKALPIKKPLKKTKKAITKK